MRRKKLHLILVVSFFIFIMLCLGFIGNRMSVVNAGPSDYQLLAQVISGEARGEPYLGKVAVGAVVMNRVKNPLFPSTIPGVVYQDWAFTSVHDGQVNIPPDRESYRAAEEAMAGHDPTHGALYFYNPARVTSYWIFTRIVTTIIGNHYFAK